MRLEDCLRYFRILRILQTIFRFLKRSSVLTDFFIDYQPTGLKLKSQENRKIRGNAFLPKTRRVLEICRKFFISTDISLDDDVMRSFLNLKPSSDLFSEGMSSQREYAGLWRSDRRLINH